MIAHPYSHSSKASTYSFLSASSSTSSGSSYDTASPSLQPQLISAFDDDDRTPRDRLQTLSSRFSSESLKGNSKPWLKPFQIISSKAPSAPIMKGIDISLPQLVSSEDQVEALKEIRTLPPRPKRTPLAARSDSLSNPPSRSSSVQALTKSPYRAEISVERSPTLPLFNSRLVSAFSTSTEWSTTDSFGSRSSSSPSKRQRFDSFSSSNPSSASFPSPARKTKPTPILTKRQPETTSFKATLLRTAQYPPDAQEEEKLVTLNVSGQKFTLPLKTLLSQSSKLGEYVKEVLVDAEIRDEQYSQQWPDALSSPIILQPGQRSPREKMLASRLDKRDSTDDQLVFGESGIFSSPLRQPEITSPIGRPKSARATILGFDELPSEAGADDWTNDYLPCIISTRRLLSVGPEEAPSLSTSSTSSDEPIVADYLVDTPSALPAQPNGSLQLFLERDPSRYEAILHFLREGKLPRSLDIGSTLSAEATLDLSSVPASILTLVLHPLIAQLQDLREEAAWLGLQVMEEDCLTRLSELNTLINGGKRPVQKRRPKAVGKAVLAKKCPTPVEQMDENWL